MVVEEGPAGLCGPVKVPLRCRYTIQQILQQHDVQNFRKRGTRHYAATLFKQGRGDHQDTQQAPGAALAKQSIEQAIDGRSESR